MCSTHPCFFWQDRIQALDKAGDATVTLAPLPALSFEVTALLKDIDAVNAISQAHETDRAGSSASVVISCWTGDRGCRAHWPVTTQKLYESRHCSLLLPQLQLHAIAKVPLPDFTGNARFLMGGPSGTL